MNVGIIGGFANLVLLPPAVAEDYGENADSQKKERKPKSNRGTTRIPILISHVS